MTVVAIDVVVGVLVKVGTTDLLDEFFLATFGNVGCNWFDRVPIVHAISKSRCVNDTDSKYRIGSFIVAFKQAGRIDVFGSGGGWNVMMASIAGSRKRVLLVALLFP